MHEAAFEALKAIGHESSYIEIYNYIIENKLFEFGAKKEKHEDILRRIIDRKCINSNLSYTTKEKLFYKKDKKYGLLEWLSEEEIKEKSLSIDRNSNTDLIDYDDEDLEREEKLINKKNSLEKEIKTLELKLENTINKENSDREKQKKYQEEISSLRKEKEQLIKYENEIDKVRSAIKILNKPANQLIESKKKFEEKQKKYSNYSDLLFSISMLIFTIVSCLILIKLTSQNEIKSNLYFYLLTVFPVMFPIIISFLFIRQVNINTKEIERINKRFILIHEINNSLEALVEINRGEDMNGKTEKIIDKLINNILSFSKNNEEKNLQDNLELNEKLDMIIKSIKIKKEYTE